MKHRHRIATLLTVAVLGLGVTRADAQSQATGPTPPRVAVRRKWMTGVAQRTISSIAVGATPSKSACHLAR
jgi:hypothetical protein